MPRSSSAANPPTGRALTDRWNQLKSTKKKIWDVRYQQWVMTSWPSRKPTIHPPCITKTKNHQTQASVTLSQGMSWMGVSMASPTR